MMRPVADISCVVMCYVLSFLWMMSFFILWGQWTRIKYDVMFRRVHQMAVPVGHQCFIEFIRIWHWGEVCCLQFICSWLDVGNGMDGVSDQFDCCFLLLLHPCVHVSLSTHISGKPQSNFAKFWHVVCGLIFLWQHCDMLYTSGYADDIMFPKVGLYGMSCVFLSGYCINSQNCFCCN